MTHDLFGKLFRYTVLFLILTELISLLTYIIPPLNQVAFFIIIIAVLIITLIKLEYGLYLLLAELFIGGHGYLFSLNINGTSISIRIGIFLIVLAVWLAQKIKGINRRACSAHLFRSKLWGIVPFLAPRLGNKKSTTFCFTRSTSPIKKAKFKLSIDKKLFIGLAFLFLFIAAGIINGLIRNEFSNVFFDFNAWIYFALVFVFIDVARDKKIVENILQILTGSTSYLALKTIGVLFLFSHHIAGIGGFFYKWIRDTGVGEITYISGTLFRIFFQSHLYSLIGFLIILTILVSDFKSKNYKHYIAPVIYLYLTSLAIIISQSRSFWVGGITALIILLFVAGWRFNFLLKKILILLIVLIIMFANQIFFIKILTNNFSGNLISDRFKNLQTEAASVSRLNQLQPLTYNIFQQIIFGYGFGKELTYQSNDPRILKTHPGGVYTTYAFEWGYLDIWLKIGALGLLAYIFLIYQIATISLKSKKPIYIGFGVGLIALVFTNIFSPYLNHPLGIGYLLLMSAIISDLD